MAAVSPPARQSHWRLLGLLLRGRRPQVAALALILALSSALPLAGPQLLRAFIDQAAGGSRLGVLALIAGAYVGIALLAQAVSVTTTYAATRVAWTATNELRGTLARHLLGMDLAYHGRHPPGELIERADGDVTSLSTFLSSFVPRVAGAALTLAGILVAVSFEDWRLGIALAIFSGLVALTIARQRNAAVGLAATNRAAVAALFGEIEERLAGAEDLRANAGAPHAVHRFHHAAARVARAGTRAEMGTIRIYNISTGVFVVGGALSLAAGTALYRAGAISLGTVFLLFQYTELLRRPIDQIVDELQRVQEAAAGITRIHTLLATQPSVADNGRGTLGPGPLAVELDGVAFAYDDGVPVIGGLTLRLEPGRVLGIVGRTGSGKTTLARLLLRLVDPVSGTIRAGTAVATSPGTASPGTANGQAREPGRYPDQPRRRTASHAPGGEAERLDLRDLREVRLAEVRSRIGLVTQDVQLFKASVRDNLTLFGAHPARDDDLTGVVERLGLGAWLRALPDGLDTMLGPGGAGTSAGEAQLLAFARVFIRDPGLIILDEAASRLDPVSEARIEHAIDLLLEGRTAVLIAHRLGTVARADEILVLEGGIAAEHGPRQALAGNPGSRFAALLAASGHAPDGALAERVAASGPTDRALAPHAPGGREPVAATRAKGRGKGKEAG
jgi:ATP-binding cassette subfamily B protein